MSLNGVRRRIGTPLTGDNRFLKWNLEIVTE